MTAPNPERVGGSFRDPLSQVFLHDGVVLRGLRDAGVDDFEVVESAAFFQNGLESGEIVATERVDPDEVGMSEWPLVLRHDRVPVVSYPYEWTFSMLRDAALLQLSLTRAAIADKCITKDATPFNVQFEGSSPLFIDIGSFEPYRNGEPWFGYEQFCRMFLNPLLLQARCGLPFQPVLRGRLSGISPGEIRSLLSFRDRWRRGMFSHVTLHARAQAKYASGGDQLRGELKSAGFGAPLIDAQLRGLERVVERIRWGSSSSTWSDYSDRSHYESDELRVKEDFVRQACRTSRPKHVVDLGANDGHFSKIAAEFASTVVAVDGDHLVVDRLYQRLKAEENRSILPLVMDLSDPSPATGWRGRERETLPDRADADLVLALALVHHLAISATVPLPEIVAWLADFDADVVVEFPHRSDQMVQRLLSTKRDGLFDGYDLPAFESALADRFDVSQRVDLPTRTLFSLSRR